jgi:hypothetical protein
MIVKNHRFSFCGEKEAETKAEKAQEAVMGAVLFPDIPIPQGDNAPDAVTRNDLSAELSFRPDAGRT